MSAAQRYIDPQVGARCAAAFVLILGAGASPAYEDGAPPGHTGGFGEATCAACHSDNDVDLRDGGLRVDGLPEEYVAGREYEVEIVLQHPELSTGGFQLAMRGMDGKTAGRLASQGERTVVVENGAERYLQHTRAGTSTGLRGTIRWRFRWLAPDGDEDVVLDLAANASNGDISALGDYVYLFSRKLSAAD